VIDLSGEGISVSDAIKITELENQVQILQNKVEELENIKKGLEEKSNNLELELNDLKARSAALNEIEAAKTNLEAEVENLKQENSQLKQDKENLNNEIQELKNESMRKDTEISNITHDDVLCLELNQKKRPKFSSPSLSLNLCFWQIVLLFSFTNKIDILSEFINFINRRPR